MPCVAPTGSSGRHACGWRLGDNGRQYHRQLQRHSFVRGALFPCGWALGRCSVLGGCGGWLVLLGGVKGEVCVCVCVCDMGVDCMVSHMCLLIARGADIPGALRRAHRTQREACLWMAAR